MTDNGDNEPDFHHIRLTGASFRVGFCDGVDRGVIADADGWAADQLKATEGTCEAIRAEAHRLIDLAVADGNYPSRYPVAAAAEIKRVLTRWCRAAQTTHHPRWQSGRRHMRYGGGPGR